MQESVAQLPVAAVNMKRVAASTAANILNMDTASFQTSVSSYLTECGPVVGLIYKLMYVTCDAVVNATLMHLLMVGQHICSHFNFLIAERSEAEQGLVIVT